MVQIEEMRDFVRAIGDRYRLGKLLGAGGWGSVFAAESVQSGQRVAVKVLSDDQGDARGRERFLQEIAIAGRLAHPGIVPMLDSGEAAGRLYYVMPLIEGPTLQMRLADEPQLPVDDAIQIASAVLDALAHAHAAGVVHRDIKPSNIILAPGGAVVTDFGIARAQSRTGRSALATTTGVTHGTPEYMSPEQAAGARAIDGRSDLYALGVVLYQMLVGSPPFTGSSERAVVARHATDPVPPISTVRPSVPPRLAAIVYRALAKAPADRFPDALSMRAALSDVARDPLVSVADRPGRRERRAWARLATAVASVLALGTAGARWATTAADTRALASADTTRLYLAPVLMAGVHDTLLEERVARAIGRWTGVRVVGASMLRRTGGVVSRPSDDELRQAALDLRARRYVRAFVAGTPSRPELSIVLTDASQAQQPLADIRTSWPADVGVQDSLLSDVVERALLRRALPMAWQGSALGSRSLPARQALAQALAAFDQWELLAADSAFEMALRYDPELAEASLWQAAARYWRGLEPSRWAAPARAAAAGSARLSPPDRLRAAALTHTLEGDPVVACAAWNQSIAADSTSFLGWFGAANCLARDRAVLPDPRSPSGWRFRTSYRAALTRYRRAFEQHPATLRSLRGDGYLELRRLLKLNAGMLREGVAASGPPAVFYALATLSADTLAFIPFPAAVFQAGRSPVLTRTLASVSAAVRRQQELFRDIAITFISSDPQGSEPREALAWAQLMLGDASALDTLRSARRLATSAPMQLRLQGEWAWMRAILSYPDDVEGLRLAADVADSVLGSPARGDVDPVLVASLAGLTGRAELAASVEAGHASTRNTGLPLPLAGPSRRLLALAASGAPGSALDPVARHLDSLLDHATAQAERRSLRGLAFGRAAALASLDVTLPHADEVIDAGPQVGEARAAWRRGDASAASRALAGIAAERRLFSAADLSLDVVLPEAELLARLGRPDEAVRWLDPVLLAVRARAAAPEPITSLVLVRAAAFRARLARETGDSATLGRRVEALRALVGRGDAMVKALVPDARGATPLQRDH